MFDRLKQWWQGEYRAPSLEEALGEEPEGPEFNRPWPAKLWHTLLKFWEKEWKWILYFVATLVGLYIAYRKL